MSYLTLEVEIDHGRIVAVEPEKLPEMGKGLLTVLQADLGQPLANLAPLEALEALQKHLKLDVKQAAEWINTIREARR